MPVTWQPSCAHAKPRPAAASAPACTASGCASACRADVDDQHTPATWRNVEAGPVVVAFVAVRSVRSGGGRSVFAFVTAVVGPMRPVAAIDAIAVVAAERPIAGPDAQPPGSPADRPPAHCPAARPPDHLGNRRADRSADRPSDRPAIASPGRPAALSLPDRQADHWAGSLGRPPESATRPGRPTSLPAGRLANRPPADFPAVCWEPAPSGRAVPRSALRSITPQRSCGFVKAVRSASHECGRRSLGFPARPSGGQKRGWTAQGW